MSEDVLSRAEEACEKLESKDESVDWHYWQAVAGDLLPQLLAEAKRLQETIDHQQNIIADLRKNSDPKAVSDLRRR